MTHAKFIKEYAVDSFKDFPATKQALVGLVQQFEVIGHDVIVVIAAKGLDIPDDIKTAENIQALFAYMQLPQLLHLSL